MICYITFAADNGKEYAYKCGGLSPRPGDLVVITVGHENKLKIVPVTHVFDNDADHPYAIKEIYGLIVPQPTSCPPNGTLIRE